MRKLRWLSTLALGMAFLPSATVAQERATITGTVMEAGTQRPLSGVQVTVATLKLTTVTDVNGRYILSVLPGTHTVRVSLLGFRDGAREVTAGVGNPGTASFELPADPLRLDEVVVTGYSQELRRNVTGAIASVKPSAVKDMPVMSVNEILHGRAPGVQVYQNSGTPGAAMTVRVRGSSSISGGNDPLYVIDGVPLTQGDYSRLSVGFGGQDLDALSDLNGAEIESIEILKDASAAAIYGSRASNGVVLITTKRGHAQRPEISFGTYFGSQRDWRRIDLLNAAQFTEIYNEGCMGRFSAPCVGFTDDGVSDRLEAVRGADTDWVDQVLRSAPISQMDGSVRGGTERARYYVSGSNVDQQGTVKAMGYSRLNARVNLDYVPTDRLTLGTNIGLSRSVTRRARNDNTIYGAFANAIANPPIYPVYNADGKTYFTGSAYANPVGMLYEAEAEDRGIRILGNTFAQLQLIEGLNAKVSVGLDQLTSRGKAWDSPLFGPWQSNGGMSEVANSFVTKTTYEGTLNFNRLLAEGHAVSGVAGTSYEDNAWEDNRVQGTSFPTEFFKYVGSAATISSGTSRRSDWGLTSYFGRLSYTFNDRITTSFNVRRDGSSKFGSNNRYGTFPSASISWRIGEESFMQNQNIVGNLSVRASYGITGNQQDLGYFASRALFAGGANYMDKPGISPSQLGNPDLKWEKTKQSNFGSDFSFLGDRLGFSVDYYNKRTDDLLVDRPVPRSTGFSSITSNVGSMENKGIDVGVRADLLRSTNGLNWSSTLSISRNRNKVLELFNHQPILGSNAIKEGEPLGFFYGYVTDGIFQTMAEVTAHARQTVNADPRRATAAGDIRFKDLNGDNIINADDRTNIGSPWPDFEGGFSNTASFRAFDLTASFQFSYGNEVYNGQRTYQDRFGSDGDNHTQRAMNRWRPDHTDTDEPRAIWGDPNQNTRVSNRFVEDGSFGRLKNVVLGYRLPSMLTRRGGVQSARIYFSGQNLITTTKYTGFDPEVNTGGATSVSRGQDFYTLPQARTITFGINVGF